MSSPDHESKRSRPDPPLGSRDPAESVDALPADLRALEAQLASLQPRRDRLADIDLTKREVSGAGLSGASTQAGRKLWPWMLATALVSSTVAAGLSSWITWNWARAGQDIAAPGSTPRPVANSSTQHGGAGEPAPKEEGGEARPPVPSIPDPPDVEADLRPLLASAPNNDPRLALPIETYAPLRVRAAQLRTIDLLLREEGGRPASRFESSDPTVPPTQPPSYLDQRQRLLNQHTSHDPPNDPSRPTATRHPL